MSKKIVDAMKSRKIETDSNLTKCKPKKEPFKIFTFEGQRGEKIKDAIDF